MQILNEQTIIVLGNVISGIGMIGLLASTTQSSKSKLLALQCFNHGCSIVSGMLLAGYSGVVQDVVSLVRNFVVLTNRQTKFLKILFVAAGLVLGIAFNNRGILGLLPIFASTQYAIIVVGDKTTERTLKWSIVVSSLCWAVYSLYLFNFINMGANLLTTATALIFLYRGRKVKNEDKVD